MVAVNLGSAGGSGALRPTLMVMLPRSGTFRRDEVKLEAIGAQGILKALAGGSHRAAGGLGLFKLAGIFGFAEEHTQGSSGSGDSELHIGWLRGGVEDDHGPVVGAEVDGAFAFDLENHTTGGAFDILQG